MYEAYRLIQSMTYAEFVEYEKLGLRTIAFFVIGIGIIMFIFGKKSILKIDKEKQRKLKHIAKMEHRSIKEQIGLIIEMFIEAYTEKNNISWDEYLY